MRECSIYKENPGATTNRTNLHTYLNFSIPEGFSVDTLFYVHGFLFNLEIFTYKTIR